MPVCQVPNGPELNGPQRRLQRAQSIPLHLEPERRHEIGAGLEESADERAGGPRIELRGRQGKIMEWKFSSEGRRKEKRGPPEREPGVNQHDPVGVSRVTRDRRRMFLGIRRRDGDTEGEDEDSRTPVLHV